MINNGGCYKTTKNKLRDRFLPLIIKIHYNGICNHNERITKVRGF